MANMLLKARGIHKAFTMGPARVEVLRGAGLEVERGEFLVIMGASGSGKSTLLHILGALDIPDRGTVEFEGRNLFGLSEKERGSYRNRSVGFVFQFYHLLPELNVLENVMITRMVGASGLAWGAVRSKARREAGEILDRVGLIHRLKHRPRELSGGERQRVAIARALVNRPALLLADEPTGNLDEAIGGDILKLLSGLNDAGQTIVMVTHDAQVASRAHRQVRLSEGTIHSVPGGGRRPADPVRKEQVRT